MSEPPDNVVSLFGREDRSERQPSPPGPDEVVLATLSRLMELALSGEIVALSAVGVTRDNKFLYTFCGNASYATVVGGIEELKFQIMQAHQQQSPPLPVK